VEAAANEANTLAFLVVGVREWSGVQKKTSSSGWSSEWGGGSGRGGSKTNRLGCLRKGTRTMGTEKEPFRFIVKSGQISGGKAMKTKGRGSWLQEREERERRGRGTDYYVLTGEQNKKPTRRNDKGSSQGPILQAKNLGS